MKDFWNGRYGVDSYAYGKAPNVFFKSFIDVHPPGKILLPADGEGRNGVYAAMKGWEVDAFDYSESGKRKALALAKEMKVEINFVTESIQQYNYKKDYYDMIGLFYVHQPEEIRHRLNRNCIAALKKGGNVVLEYFSKEQISKLSGGPKKEAMLASKEMLQDDFAELEMLLLKKENVVLEEGEFHIGEASVIRMIAKK